MHLHGTMDDSPLSRNQGTLKATDVSSPSPSDFGVACVSGSPRRNDVSTLPSGDAGRRGTRSIDTELCEERHANEQPSSFSCSSLSYAQTPAPQKPDIFQRHESTDARVSPYAANSIGCELASFTTDFQSRSDRSVAGGGGTSLRSDCPLLESLLVCGQSSREETATAEHANAGQAEKQTIDALMPPDAAGSFVFELTDIIGDFESGNDGSVADGGRTSSRSDCPLLTSLLIWGHSTGDKTATAERTAVEQAEIAACTVSCQRQDRADPGHQTPPPNGVDATAAVQPSQNTACNMRRRLSSCDLMQIRKMARIYLKAMRLPPCCRQQMPSLSLLNAYGIHRLQHLVVHARNSVLRLLHFAYQLPQFRRKPPHVQVALLKAASAGCMVLHLAQSYNCVRGCWLGPHGAEFRPPDLARLVPSPTRPELWDDVAAVGVFLKSLVCPDSESVNGDNDELIVRFFSLLNAVLIMSPENVPCVRESDRDIAADVSDFQQSCIILLRRHLESSLSVVRAAKLLPTMLSHLIAIRSLALNVRTALLSERMVRRDSVLFDALSLERAMF